jgi:parallel beta-helix repeat protein
VRRALLAATLTAIATVASFSQAVTASAGTIVVAPGASINDAVQAAQPGDTIQLQAGVYEDVVVIKTDDITIQGAGNGTDGSIIRPPADLPGRCFNGVAGVCVFGDFDANTPVDGVTVTGVRAEGFDESGFIAILTTHTTFEADAGVDSNEYGLAAFQSSGTVFQDNIAAENGLAGIYVGDSPRANATISGNDLSDNAWGMFLRDAAHGVITGNMVHDNCVGILILDSPDTIRAGKYTISGNTIDHNTAFCPGETAHDPDVSGIGIAIAGGRGNTIEDNTIQANKASRPVAFHGGIVLVDLGSAPRNNTISGNTFVRNHPNVYSDGSGSGNVVSDNDCTPHC